MARSEDDLDPALAARFLGPFALTGLLLPRLRESARARVVTVVSPAHRLATPEVPAEQEWAREAGDGRLRRRTAWAAPAEAALAAMMFALDSDARARGGAPASLGCAGSRGRARRERCARRGRAGSTAIAERARRGPGILRAALGAVEQRNELAPWPALMAATADLPARPSSDPATPRQLAGAARIVDPPQRARDREARRAVVGAQPWTSTELRVPGRDARDSCARSLPADHADVLGAQRAPRRADLAARRAPAGRDGGVADGHCVVDVDGAFAGFVLTFAAGSAYDGENFGWFSERYPDLAYLDRVVVHEDFRRPGLGLTGLRRARGRLPATGAHPGGQPRPAQRAVAGLPPGARVRRGRSAGVRRPPGVPDGQAA